MWIVGVLVIVGGAAVGLQGQTQGERVTVAFSDPGRPGTLNVQLVRGSVTVRGADRRDVLIETAGQDQTTTRSDPGATGLRRLTQRGSFVVEEDNNTMKVTSSRVNADVDFTIQVPQRTNLRIGLVNDGRLVVEGVEGDIETNNVNGPISLTNVAGSVVANSNNGRVSATLTRVTAQKAMAFTSLNGVVDVTLPASVRANVKLRTDNGDVFTDFDLQMTTPKDGAVVKDSRGRGGAYRIEIDRAIYGTINGGGPEFELRSFNGNVYLRRGK
jgi:DUF4097 and DUF4098 domain-containing protein YvlB